MTQLIFKRETASRPSGEWNDDDKTKLGWDVVARCSNSREPWTANVSLSVKDNHLSWKSQRGTQTYLRCQREEMMAQAQ
jgi:hypothetical protein